jgi:hypothetical protein
VLTIVKSCLCQTPYIDITPSYRQGPYGPNHVSEAFHGKCDSFERDIITGRFRSFSTMVILGVSFDSSY